MVPGEDMIAEPDGTETNFFSVDSCIYERLRVIIIFSEVYGYFHLCQRNLVLSLCLASYVFRQKSEMKFHIMENRNLDGVKMGRTLRQVL